MQHVYATIADRSTLPYILTQFQSLRTIYPNSVLYMLTIESSIYHVMEQMEYDDIYIIACDELLEHYPLLMQHVQECSPKKFISTLPLFLLHYILRYNPLVHSIQYLYPYIYWICSPYLYSDQACFLTHDKGKLPYYVYCPNTNVVQEELITAQNKACSYIFDPDSRYSEDMAYVSLTFIQGIEREATLLFTQDREVVHAQSGTYYLENRQVLGFVTRYLRYRPYQYFSFSKVQASCKVQYNIGKYIARYVKNLEANIYKCHIFGLDTVGIRSKKQLYSTYMHRYYTTARLL